MSKSKASALQSKSPAEFFAEHQNIAGFDNPGKSIFTTLREFIENGLDAAEHIGVLPQIEICVERLTLDEFNDLRGITQRKRKDVDLYKTSHSDVSLKKTKSMEAGKSGNGAATVGNTDVKLEDSMEFPGTGTMNPSNLSTSKEKDSNPNAYQGYYRISCRDNGVGMPHEKIPNMLGIVLSSTKYGLRQTRGKFGLGAKMALVWSKKSTGLPIEIISSTDSLSNSATYCKLDLDIQENKPNVLKHEYVSKTCLEKYMNSDITACPHTSNFADWTGTEISVVVGGNWSMYQNRFLLYLRQLAVITPYANLSFIYDDHVDKRKNLRLSFTRRSDTCPTPPKEVCYHPSALDNLLLESLIHHSKLSSLKSFLTRELQCITPDFASRIITELGAGYSANTDISKLTKSQIHDIVNLLKQMKFPKPDATCLSPLGEYSLRLGVIKEYKPDMITTTTMPPAVSQGHVFQVECAIAVGGKLPSGLTVYRFANRIPLLFEGGNDIVTQVATKKIKYGSYKIKQSDALGIFVSIVSTKIPFKGTSKEYIGDDKGPLNESITAAIRDCCSQLKKTISAESSKKEKRDRKKKLLKHVDDAARAINGTIELFRTHGMVSMSKYAKGEYTPQLQLPESLVPVAEEIMDGWISTKTTTSARGGIVTNVSSTANGSNSKEDTSLVKLSRHLRDYIHRTDIEESAMENAQQLPKCIYYPTILQQEYTLPEIYHRECSILLKKV